MCPCREVELVTHLAVLGLANQRGCGQAVLARVLLAAPWDAVGDVLARWPWARSHRPHHNLPFVFCADVSRGCSCVSYTHWEDVGFSLLWNAAARSSAGWASDSAASDGQGTVQMGSPLSVYASAQTTVPLQTLILLLSTTLLILPHKRGNWSRQQEIPQLVWRNRLFLFSKYLIPFIIVISAETQSEVAVWEYGFLVTRPPTQIHRRK